MVFKKFKNFILSFLILISILPCNIYAYSDYILASGKNIGIQIKSDGITVVGLYSVNNISPGKDAGISLGDYIIAIDDNKVDTIDEMVRKIDDSKIDESVKITYLRDGIKYDTNLKLVKDNNLVYKTGLYVKDTINGIGTLTYIDPGTNMYGALGHPIIDKNTSSLVNIKDGKIYKSVVTGITKSKTGIAGEKNALFYSNEVFGNINKNTYSGIFGNYTDNINNLKLYKVAVPKEIKKGKAKILTVLNNNDIEQFDIEIINLSTEDNLKNITFNVTDKNLIEKSGGIVQGMSGSPIIQDDKIVGAVTHVVVDNPTKGYGIYITNMLEEMEKEF